MIRYMLKCDRGHDFESWFASADSFETLRAAGRIECAICGSRRIEKSLMAPAVACANRKGEMTRGETKRDEMEKRPLSQPASPQEEALGALRRHLDANSDYVGMDFTTEARAMHAGDKPERAIHGEAKLDEARALLEEGIPVAPIPFLPARKAN